MQAVSSKEFWRLAAAQGFGVDPRYPDSGCLSLIPLTDHARFWVVPPDPATWPHFVSSLLDGLDQWEAGVLWPRSGVWPQSGQSRSHNSGVRNVILRGAGVPDGWAGAIRFEREEEDVLIAILFSAMAFGWCVDDDLFFIPEHARQMLQTDHHNVIHAECRFPECVRKLVAHMATEGYQLPTEPPDWTFKRPAWMNSAEAPPGNMPLKDDDHDE